MSGNRIDETSVAPPAEPESIQQVEQLSLPTEKLEGRSTTAIEADLIAPQDPTIVAQDNGPPTALPHGEPEKVNELGNDNDHKPTAAIDIPPSIENSESDARLDSKKAPSEPGSTRRHSLQKSIPAPQTNRLFPALPLYGPPSIVRSAEYMVLRATSFVLSCTFLSVIVVCAAGSAVPKICRRVWILATFGDPDASRPFRDEEKRNREMRKEEEKTWKKERIRKGSKTRLDDDNESEAVYGEFIPTEGGPDPVICDVGYYARRVGLDMEEFRVQTEDGFIIRLWHIYNPLEYTPLSEEQRAARGPEVFTNQKSFREPQLNRKPKYPVLMIHGLLQSAGAYCVLDDNSLAFYLCKAGYDVWLGNNRCGFDPEHSQLSYGDPRMWSWNIREMGVMDLPALTSRVLSETGFSQLGFIGHSQGTTQGFVAFAKDQRPELGNKISVFCALAPAAYSGPLLNRFYFKFVRLLPPAVFRICFGIHAFIPFMMPMQKYLPSRLYGWMGYHVFTYLFNWSDTRWDRGVRNRCFKFAPVYISAESMRWWLGRDCFAKQTCILATREECDAEDALLSTPSASEGKPDTPRSQSAGNRAAGENIPSPSEPWYDSRSPPMALWIPGSDELVDGRKLLARFKSGREPHLRLVHSKVIEEYEHLDVIWAMDNIKKVGSEVKEVLWKTCNVRDVVRVPKGCETVDAWVDSRKEEKCRKEEDLD
jgi:pimeloyl-ACP methyl ester carboxylesterase